MKTELLAWLINATIATSLASIAVLLLRKLLQRWLGAEIAYRLWVVVPLAAIAAMFSPPQFAPTAMPIVGTHVSAIETTQVVVQSTWIASNADLWLLGAWAIGLFALVALLVWQQRRFIARMRLQPRADGSWRSGSVDAAPALLGLLRPRLVLPAAFEAEYSDDEQRLVIAHERMHQQRHDPWALAVCAALRVLFWFNPLLHVAAGCFRRDMEFACDAAVLRLYPDQRRLYASALLKTQLAGSTLPVGCLWHYMPPMKERLMLLKLARPMRRHAWIGIAVIVSAAAAISGVALAGHDAAANAADALAAPTPGVGHSYAVDMHVSIDGKHVDDPKLISHIGQTAMIKLAENDKTIGFRFHLEPQSNPALIEVIGDVLGGKDQQVVSSPHLVVSLGKLSTIEVSDKSGSHVYRIDLLVNVSDHASPSPHADRRMRTESYARANAAPGERREIEIVRNGTPAPDDESDVDDENMQGDTPAPGEKRVVRREITTRAPSDRRVEKTVIIESGGDNAPQAPLPPLPPTPDAVPPPPPPPPMGMRAPPAPHAPPSPLAMRAPPPPVAPTPAAVPPPPPPMGMRAPPAPPAPPTTPAMRAPPPPAPPIPSEQLGSVQKAPAYPRAALAKGIGGEVQLKVLVGADGSVKHAQVVSSHPAGVFDQTTLDAAKKWHFNPPVNAKGQPVSGYVMVPVSFVAKDR
jgi:TonB family protein